LARNKAKFNRTVDEALETKEELNLAEATPNKRGKTTTLAVAGYLQKKRNLDAKLAAGKITEEEHDIRLHDIDIDAGQPVSQDDGRQRTFDREAWELMQRAKKSGYRSDVITRNETDIATRHSKEEEYVEEVIDPVEARAEIERLKRAGKKKEAAAIETILTGQQTAIRDAMARAKRKGLPEDSIFIEEEVEEVEEEHSK
jgi:hypothetical protein